MVTACPPATRSPPYTQVFSGPREYSSGALIRCPPGDQPGAGGKVRGITGPSSSAQITVEPGGGAVQSSTTRVLLGANSGSVLVAQLRVRRQRTFSASRIRRTWL